MIYPRYNKASCVAWSMYERYGLTETPVSLHHLIESQKIRLLSFDMIKAKDLLDGVDALYSGKIAGRKIIAYDSNAYWGRVRFSLAHELGHHALEHYEHPYSSEKVMEQEANRFAAELLCPQPLVHLAKLYTPNDICNTFDVSIKCAQVVTERMTYFKPDRWQYYISMFRVQFRRFLEARENMFKKQAENIRKYYPNYYVKEWQL